MAMARAGGWTSGHRRGARGGYFGWGTMRR
jgi:hypothetical protein